MNKATGEAKGASELIEEVAGKWNSLSDAEQRATSVGVTSAPSIVEI